MSNSELVTQTKIAFDFIQKLYLESSFLIKEVEGLLSTENEKFIMGRTSGYAVLASSSNGLDPNQVKMWLYKKISVIFIPNDMTELIKGQTVTPFEFNPRLLFLRIVFNDNELSEPSVFFGILQNIYKVDKKKEWPSKIEQVMSLIESRLEIRTGKFSHKDSYISLDAEINKVNLYDINASKDIEEKLIEPWLRLYRERPSY
jgi:hypothetical protein